MMSNCDLVYGSPANSFRPMYASMNLNSSEETDQSNATRHNWETAGSVNDDLKRVMLELKPKIFKCKTCTYATRTKEAFWQHSRIHIKPEKMRTCPICNFVTEFKHHLEYHVRNHFGSKPFKCEKCSYSCVSNSMLKSHMKSHSGIYQYNCADCAYATKYLYTFKIHLRKFQHKPGVVLNSDGTINPEPVIDVYGTKRGPKQQSKYRHVNDAQGHVDHIMRLIYSQMMSSEMVALGQISPMLQMSPILSMPSISQMSPILSMSPILPTLPMGNHENVGTMKNTLGINGLNGFPYHTRMTHIRDAMVGKKFPAGIPSINSTLVNGDMTAQKVMQVNVTNSGLFPSESALNTNPPEGNCVQDYGNDIIRIPDMMNHRVPKYEDDYADEEDAPLDLSKSGQTSHESGIQC